MFWRKQRDCQHLHARVICGDEIIASGYKRGYCPECGRLMKQIPQSAIARVRELHAEVNSGYSSACSHCCNSYGGFIKWPCPTIKALENQ